MPEIKNTFLAGKMNKSLDDRLLPEGEYRDALNIQVTKSEGADVGAVQNLKGNTNVDDLLDAVNNTGVIIDQNYKVIGSCFDDQKNLIFWFLTDNTNHYIFQYNKTTKTTSKLISGATLNFNKNNFVQANVIENYLFFTDGINEPRKLDIYGDYNSYEEYDITVAKIAPQFAPEITVLEVDSEADADTIGNYIEEKFVRFAYRYKFSDNTYSVYSPFSNIIFSLETNVLSESQIQDAYSKGELDFLINAAKKISIQPKDPNNGTSWGLYDIQQIDILLKASDSPAVLLLDSLKENDLNSAFIYKSEKPKAVLPENQLTRVYDNVPRSAIAQEVVGNRIVYGNFTQDFNIDTTVKLPFTLNTISKNLNGSYLDYLGVKSNRTYEVGLVFSDDYGRTSPVMFGQQKSIYLNKFVQGNYDKELSLEFTGNLQSIIDAGFKYYSVVVKQSEQEYYNIYTPGLASVDGRSYFSVFGDNINKIPIDTSTYNSETNINTTSVKTYLSVENKALNDGLSGDPNGITIEAFEYIFENMGSSFPFITNITNIIPCTNNPDPLKINGVATTITTGGITVDPQNPAVYTLQIGTHNIVQYASGDFQLADIGLTIAEHGTVDVYVDGIKQQQYINFNYTKSPTPTLTFLPGSIPEETQQIYVFLKYNNLSVFTVGVQNSLLSLSSVSGSITVDQYAEAYNVFLSVSAFEEEFFAPTTPFNPVNLEEIKITGVSTRNNFGSLNDNSTIYANSTQDLEGIYKVGSGYLLAEVDGLFGVPFYNATGPVLKYADLAILETKGFESAINIYFETATQGLISDLSNNTIVRIKYYNCINLKTPSRTGESVVWQESRIKGGFNEVSMDYGVQAYITNEDYGQVSRISSIIYSGILNNETKVNNTNQFPSGEAITRTLDPVYGSIQKLYADTDDLLIFQEEKVSQALIDKDVIYTAEGQGLTTAGQQVISQINAYSTNYGIGTNPESFAVYAGRKYFVDRPKGVVLRLSRDGITEISNYGMRSYFRDVLTDSITSIIGCWDMYNKEYILSIQGSENITLGYDESNNGWVSRYSYIPEAGGSLDGSFYTFKQGELYLHNSNNLHNKFYNDQARASVIELIFNQNPSANKNFSTINYEGTNTWNISSISTDINDIGLPIAKNLNSQNDTDTLINLSVFKSFDGKYFSNIINNSNSKSEEIVFDKDISGVKGHVMKVTLENAETSYQELFAISTNYNINSY